MNINEILEYNIIQFFLNENNYPHRIDKIKHIETHISHVFLTGEYAYKIKKSLDLGFLDFTSLEQRKYYCKQELTLNRRYAPELYLQVLPLYKQGDKISFSTPGEIIEYCLQMRQFDQASLFSELIHSKRLTASLIIEATDCIINLHKIAEVKANPLGDDWLMHHLNENFKVLDKYSSNICEQGNYNSLRSWIRKEEKNCQSLMHQRQTTHLKLLHADLHLANICIFQGKVTLFDGIEFGDNYAVCDTWADIGFFIMDLLYRKQPYLAFVVINHYLEHTDDFEGLLLLRLFLIYRATVRAKVACLKLKQVSNTYLPAEDLDTAKNHLNLCFGLIEKKVPFIIGIGGLSGTGKTTIARELARRNSYIHVRSDVVRKHLLGIDILAKAPLDSYSPASSKSIYQEINRRALLAIKAGYPVIVDATHLTTEDRNNLECLAESLQVKFYGFWCETNTAVAHARIKARTNDSSDADSNVRTQQEKIKLEQLSWTRINTTRPLEVIISEMDNALLKRLSLQ